MSATFAQLARLTTATGLYEHALLTEPRIEHGMCVDDVARALVVTARQGDPSPQVVTMSATYLRFLLDAQGDDGRMHNRRTPAGVWLDEVSAHDHWGRALWAFGVAATHSPDAWVQQAAARGAARAMLARSTYPRSMAYAALGAAQLAERDPGDKVARRVLYDARQVLPAAGYGADWPWPEERLSYANAVLPEAMIEIGVALHDDALRRDGLMLLAWLDDEQTVDGHLSVVPTGGRGREDRRPGFDQQPIEVAALAEAARTALRATRDSRWADLLTRCEEWFVGNNDAGLPMRDADTGGGFDGLEDGSVNENQGAESTLAWLATRELARLAAAPVVVA
ncbi:MAG: glycosyltransferase [Cellulomonas sp.]|nr:glycosyltransferase [Cellulomonas sp.]